MVNAEIQKEHFATQISSGKNSLVADEPQSAGGTEKGFSPTELLCAALASCTCITLRMYADRKTWPLMGITVQVEAEKSPSGEGKIFRRTIDLKGALAPEMRLRLLEIANHCPVHKTLSGTNTIETRTA